MHSSESNLPGLSIGACSVMSSHGGRSKHDPALIHHALQRVVEGESLNFIAKAAGIPEATLRRYRYQPETIDRCAGLLAHRQFCRMKKNYIRTVYTLHLQLYKCIQCWANALGSS